MTFASRGDLAVSGYTHSPEPYRDPPPSRPTQPRAQDPLQLARRPHRRPIDRVQLGTGPSRPSPQRPLDRRWRHLHAALAARRPAGQRGRSALAAPPLTVRGARLPRRTGRPLIADTALQSCAVVVSNRREVALVYLPRHEQYELTAGSNRLATTAIENYVPDDS